MGYLDKTGLIHLWGKIREFVSNKTKEEISLSQSSSVKVVTGSYSGTKANTGGSSSVSTSKTFSDPSIKNLSMVIVTGLGTYGVASSLGGTRSVAYMQYIWTHGLNGITLYPVTNASITNSPYMDVSSTDSSVTMTTSTYVNGGVWWPTYNLSGCTYQYILIGT